MLSCGNYRVLVLVWVYDVTLAVECLYECFMTKLKVGVKELGPKLKNERQRVVFGAEPITR